MYEILKNSSKVRSAYKVNSFIYSFKMIPGIGKLIPDTVYGEPAFKQLFIIFGALFNIFVLTIGVNVLYLFSLYFLAKSLLGGTLISFLVLYLCGVILLTIFVPVAFNSKRDANYLVYFLRMDPKKYLLGNYLVSLLKIYLVFTPTLLIIMHLLHANLLIAFVLPLVYLSFNIITSFLRIFFIKNSKVIAIFDVILFLALFFLINGYILGFDSYNFYPVVIIVSVAMVLLGVLAFIYLMKYKKYYKTFKELYAQEAERTEYKEAQLKAITSSITLDENVSSNYDGFDFIHDLFVKRHRKILTDPVNKISLLLGVIVISAFMFTYFFDIKEYVHKFLMNGMAYLAFALYFINRGDQICKAMFMNCDCALLNYRLYRSPKTILEMFTRRLKTSIKLNLLPSSIIAFGGLALLMVCGDTNIMNYALFFIVVVCLSMFFSIHYLVMYYLLQPFSDKTEVKNKAYSFVNILVYLLWYLPIYFEIPLPLKVIGPIVIVFTIIYSIVGLVLAYRLAPKTFKIRL